jgi:hypothetical protein
VSQTKELNNHTGGKGNFKDANIINHENALPAVSK